MENDYSDEDEDASHGHDSDDDEDASQSCCSLLFSLSAAVPLEVCASTTTAYTRSTTFHRRTIAFLLLLRNGTKRTGTRNSNNSKTTDNETATTAGTAAEADTGIIDGGRDKNHYNNEESS